jgi:hypothetical protein
MTTAGRLLREQHLPPAATAQQVGCTREWPSPPP